MAGYTPYIKRYWNAHFKTIWADIFGKPDPDEFATYGSQIYYGYQGEGKTLSMYYHFTRVKRNFPKCVIVSNLQLLEYQPIQVSKLRRALENGKPFEELYEEYGFDFWKDNYISYSSHDDLIWLLRRVRTGKYGVVFLIDEIHNYFHSHDSKSMPMWVVQVFSQQRKQRILILGTAQSWRDVIKVIRDQIDNLVKCKRRWFMIWQYAADPREIVNEYGEDVLPDWRKKGFFFQTKRIRDGFDTRQVIDSGRHVMGGEEMRPNVVKIEKVEVKK